MKDYVDILKENFKDIIMENLRNNQSYSCNMPISLPSVRSFWNAKFWELPVLRLHYP